MYSLNRWLGFPNRIFCTSKTSMEALIKAHNGRRPCFISVQRYKGKDEAFMNKFPFDSDGDPNLELQYREIDRLLSFATETNIPHYITASGGKGFHFYLEFEEEPVTELSNSKLYSIQYALNKYYKLKTMDEPLFAKKSLMIRIPTTKYVGIKKIKDKEGRTIRKEKIINGNYCRYIPDDEFRKGLQHVKKLIRTPGIQPPIRQVKMKLDDIIPLIPDYRFKRKHDFTASDEDIVESESVAVPDMNVIKGLPCLQQIAKLNHPLHPERVELVAWLKFMGYRDMSITSFISTLSWVDFDRQRTYDNSLTIKPRLPKCTWLRTRYPNLCKNCSLKK